MPLFETRENGDAACHDILENQSCLLPNTLGENNKQGQISSVDQVILCWSPLLESYCADAYSSSYINQVKKAYSACCGSKADFIRELKNFQDSLLSAEAPWSGFHHVLTELGFLSIRHDQAPEKLDIKLVSLGKSHMPLPHLPFATDRTELVITLEAPISKEILRRNFLKLLHRVYSDQHGLLNIYQSSYEEARWEIEKVGDTITLQALRTLIEQSKREARQRAKRYEETNLRVLRSTKDGLTIADTLERQGRRMSEGFGAMAKNSQEDAARKDDSKNMKCLNAFNTGIDPVFEKNKNISCAPETGHWFFHHPMYETFRSSKGRRLLFVTAEAGGGKSTVMKTLIDRLADSDNPPLLAYFFFKEDEDKLRSVRVALSTLIHQLLSQNRTLIQLALGFYEQYGDAVRERTDVMWQILLKIASRASHNVFCVLDALDECLSQDRKQLTTKLGEVFNSEAQSVSRLKFVVSSRPYEDSDHPYWKLGDSDRIGNLTGENARVQSDIRNVISFRAQALAKKRRLSQETQDLLIAKLREQNTKTRSFLAIRMAFELMVHDPRLHRQAKERTINNILADIPQSLGQQFDELLRKSHDKDHAWKLFCVILAARRTLKIDEFKVIYALTQPSSGEPPKSYDDLELSADDENEDFKKLVRSRCGLFITFGKNSVHLFHLTAREHLMTKAKILGDAPYVIPAQIKGRDDGKAHGGDGTSWKGCISAVDANMVCAEVCLDILTFELPESWVLER